MDNDIQVSDAKLYGGLNGDRVRVGGSITFGGGAIVGTSTFLDSTVGVDLSISNTMLADYVDLEAGNVSPWRRSASFSAKGMRIGGTAYFGPSLLERSGSLNLLEMNVAGNIEINDAIFNDKLLAPLMQVGESIFIHESVFNGDLVMNGIIVAQHLDMAGNKFYGNIDLARSSVGRDFRLADGGRHEYKWDTTFADNLTLDLRSAQVGMVQDEFGWRGHPEPWPDNLKLEGFLYGSFGDVRDVSWAEEWLAKQPQRDFYHSPSTQFNEQPYKELAAYFKSIGDEEGGDQILHDARDRELTNYWANCRWGALSSCLHAGELCLFNIGINYGVGPWQIRTLLWIFVFTTAGVVILRWSPPHRYLKFWWRLGASLNRLIPVLELRKEFTEFFERRNALHPWQKTYFAIHAIVGFMLASFILAALAGLTPSK